MRVPPSLQRLFRFLVRRQAPVPQRSSTPLRLTCADFGSVPSAEDLASLAVVGQHVVLQFPPALREGKRQVIERLAPLLPGHSVFDSGPGPGGTECITVHKVIDEQVVLENLTLFLRALRDFSDTAHDLCRRLAESQGIRPESLLARRADIKGSGTARLGSWTYAFHGLECCFTHRRTGQVVDVRIEFGAEFGVLDPYFLSRFLRTTPAHREAARLLQDDFHDARRVLEILKARGLLREVEVACEVLGGAVRRGWILDPGSLET